MHLVGRALGLRARADVMLCGGSSAGEICAKVRKTNAKGPVCMRNSKKLII